MVIQVLTTGDKRDALEAIAKNLLEEKLIACAQIVGPIKSMYWWKGEIAEDEEYLCIMKTKDELFHLVEEKIRKLHPYEVPEIVAVRADFVSKNYESWLTNEVIGSIG